MKPFAISHSSGYNGPLGFANTQAVMYPLDSRGRVFTGLSADDVNMVSTP